jgi:hypothetical protein
MMCEISASQPGANPSPVKIAVFDFELDDLSGGARLAGDPAADRAHLDGATSEARRLMAASGRYRLVDGGQSTCFRLVRV